MYEGAADRAGRAEIDPLHLRAFDRERDAPFARDIGRRAGTDRGEQRGVDAADERLPAPIEANDGAAIADRENVGRRRAGQRPQGCGDAGGERPPSRRLEAIRGAARADGPGRASREADHSEEVVL